jgi:hypothetical protein
MEKSLLLGVNAKWGLLVIFGEFGKICPSAFIQGFMQKVKEVFSKILYWPRANLHTQHQELAPFHAPRADKQRAQRQHQTPKPKPRAQSIMKVQVLKVLFIEICRCQGESIRSSVSFVTTQKYVL